MRDFIRLSMINIANRFSVIGHSNFYNLSRNVLEVRNLKCLMIAMGWSEQPVIAGNHLYDFDYLEDLNERRIRDAEVIAAACANCDGKTILEIGTAHGETTVLMSENAKTAQIYTINIPPDEIENGGVLTTFAPSIDDIGRAYKALGLSNINQIYANTASWVPNIGVIHLAFIDGCHDADFVYNDTKKILASCVSGSLILWHDFNPGLSSTYGWINNVCSGVERLYRDGLIKGRILHLQDSWVGLYRVP